MDHAKFMKAAIEEARKGRAAGGIPIGSVLVLDGEIIGRGHNQRVQKGSTIRHAEMDCLEETGRIPLCRPAICVAEPCCFTASRTLLLAKIRPFRGLRITSEVEA